MEKDGLEIPDSTPVSVPFGYRRPETLQEQMARMIRVEVSRIAGAQGYETFEEADDFDVDDDADLPYSPHEVVEMQEEVPASQFNKIGEDNGKRESEFRSKGTARTELKGTGERDGRVEPVDEIDGKGSGQDEKSGDS